MSDQPKQNIVFIHGSGQSALSFNYLDVFLPEHNILFLEYDTQEPPDVIVDRFVNKIRDVYGLMNFSIIAHSYGCLLGMKCSEKFENIDNFVALSAPWGGSRTARWLNMVFRQSKLFEATKPGSDLIISLSSINNKFKITNVITEGTTKSGNALAGLGSRPNDGLLTVETQESVPANFNNVEHCRLKVSHNEILLTYDTVDILNKVIFYAN
jgi:pimeloyl-ACP methyl ester carboxylesterase